eukprot:626893-Pelagomonas_calceolata.AAC.2
MVYAYKQANTWLLTHGKERSTLWMSAFSILSSPDVIKLAQSLLNLRYGSNTCRLSSSRVLIIGGNGLAAEVSMCAREMGAWPCNTVQRMGSAVAHQFQRVHPLCISIAHHSRGCYSRLPRNSMDCKTMTISWEASAGKAPSNRHASVLQEQSRAQPPGAG